MAAKYSPYQIIQLLQASAWKCKTTLDYTGFSKLSESIIAHNVGRGHVDINQEYLNELHLAAQKAMTLNDKVGKNETYINAILSYNDCASWKEFQEESARSERFLDIAKIDFSASEKDGITVVYDKAEGEKLASVITFLKSTSKLSINSVAIEGAHDQTIIDQIKTSFVETPFVIWCISDQHNQLDSLSSSSAFQEQLESGGLIPIRMSKVVSERHLKASFLGEKAISSGLLGLFLSIILIQQSIELFEVLSAKNGSKKSEKNSSGLHIGKNVGTVLQVKKVKGGNVTLTGSFNQNFYNKKK